MSTVSVYSYTHSTTYVADNILRSIKDVIRLSGLDPSNFVSQWETYSHGIKAWLQSRHLRKIVLEIYHPKTDGLIGRWDVNIAYDWSDGDGTFFVDTDQIKYAIRKAGVLPSDALYSLLLQNEDGYPEIAGWKTVQFRSTAGMVSQSVGTTVKHGSLGASMSYLRKA